MNAAAARDGHEDGRERRPASLRPACGPAATSTDAVWIARLAHRTLAGAEEHSLVLVNSGRFPAGTPVDFSARDAGGRRPTGWLVDVRYRARDGQVLRIDVSDTVAAPAAPLWFAEIAHASSGVPSASLVAFAGGGHPPGALVGPHEVARQGMRMRDRVGEIRWWVRSGVVETVTVEPALRRQGIGRVLVTAAEGLRLVRGWAPLTTGGQLTDSGAAWLAGAPSYWRPRLTGRSAHLPPGDEPDEPTGVGRVL